MTANQSHSRQTVSIQPPQVEQSLSPPNLSSKNTSPVQVMNKMSFWEHIAMYWEFFFVKNNRVPQAQLSQQKVEMNSFSSTADNQLQFSWLGHSSLLINIDGQIILTDPVFERKVSPIGPTRFHKDLPLNLQDLHKIDVVIISHNHYDHLNKFSIKSLMDITELFIVPRGVAARLIDWGVAKTKIVELNWWDEYQLTKTVTIAATPAQHFSGRGLTDKNKTLWASWAIISANHRVFFSGDSGYFGGFKEIGDKYGPFDMTFIECGAYNPKWSNIHMFPEQTVQAHKDLKGKILQPIHWATFDLSLHSWYDPIERLTDAATRENVQLSTPIAGETLHYPFKINNNFWWKSPMIQSKNYINISDTSEPAQQPL